MKVNVQFLNVGWGDAHLIQLPSGKVTFIDGGDGRANEDQDHPLDWLNRNGVNQLDWMILTHIHEDHLNGLVDIAKNKKIMKAILPYEPFKLPLGEQIQSIGSDQAQRVYQMLNQYLELVQLLQEQGAEIKWRQAYASEADSVIWAEEGFILTHLYPWEGDPLPAYETLLQGIVDLENSAIKGCAALERFFDLSNDDSSVYRLSAEHNLTENILFGGDQLEAGWERLAGRTQLKAKVWKVSHHGMKDGFNARILSWIQPDYCVIPISMEKSVPFQPSWDELRLITASEFHFTGEVKKGETRHFYTGNSINAQIGG